ncbi:MAG: ADP-ribosylglycohydrolase family protein [Candidatus Hydrogenedentes bacterium]|nr:ADP-ribosylglycohydrolase family protein [Candidatus Hydrogenedentota bacterium]
MAHAWLYLGTDDLRTERLQLEEEGRDTAPLAARLKALEEAGLEPDTDPEGQAAAQALLDEARRLPLRAGYAYDEPSGLDAIRHARPDGPRRYDTALTAEVLADKLSGAWLGRCSGCLLGKPVEGWRTDRLWGYLRDLDQYPLHGYFRSDVPEDIARKYDVRPDAPFIDRVDCMPEDDDTNYTALAVALLKKHGAAFTPRDVADFWMESLPILHTCTAERVAYRNFVAGIAPPESAQHRNPYREWIGAQIRADAFGYVAPGYPKRAAEFAWRDASISHVKNGIYGEMWVAAMIAAAAVETAPARLIEVGLSEIPARSRLAGAIHDVLAWHHEGIDAEAAIARIHKRWDEHLPHHWCHTISNAQIVALALLWGEGDFAKSICTAVQTGFDTDCNGATVGSIMGMLLGEKRLPEEWIAPLNGTLQTGVAGYHTVKIAAMAAECLQLWQAFQAESET